MEKNIMDNVHTYCYFFIYTPGNPYTLSNIKTAEIVEYREGNTYTYSVSSDGIVRIGDDNGLQQK